MTEQDKTLTSAAAVIAPDKGHKYPVWLAVTSIILTIAAWAGGGYSAVAAIICCCAAIVLGSFALKSHSHGIRNTAITSIIAAAVLLVVIVAFLIVIYVGLRSV